jgi:hypothetical protein
MKQLSPTAGRALAVVSGLTLLQFSSLPASSSYDRDPIPNQSDLATDPFHRCLVDLRNAEGCHRGRLLSCEGEIGVELSRLRHATLSHPLLEVQRERLLAELRQILSNPLTSIHQGEKFTCSATVLLAKLALSKPEFLAKLAVDLIVDGTAVIGRSRVELDRRLIEGGCLKDERAVGLPVESFLQQILQESLMELANDSLEYSYLSDEHWGTDQGVPNISLGIRGLVPEDAARLVTALDRNVLLRVSNETLSPGMPTRAVESLFENYWGQGPDPILASLAWAGVSRFEGAPHAVLVIGMDADFVLVWNPDRSSGDLPFDRRIFAVEYDPERQLWLIPRAEFLLRLHSVELPEDLVRKFTDPSPGMGGGGREGRAHPEMSGCALPRHGRRGKTEGFGRRGGPFWTEWV